MEELYIVVAKKIVVNDFWLVVNGNLKQPSYEKGHGPQGVHGNKLNYHRLSEFVTSDQRKLQSYISHMRL